MATGIWSRSYRDYDKQVGVTSINIANPSAANFASHLTLSDALRNAMDAVTLGVHAGTRMTYVIPGSANPATDPAAMRGNKWVIKATDSLIELAAGVPNPSYNKPFDTEIPTADLSLRVGNSNQIWAAGDVGIVPEMDALVDAFQDFALSPNGGSLLVREVVSTTRTGG